MIRRLFITILTLAVICQMAATQAFGAPPGKAVAAVNASVAAAQAPTDPNDATKVPHYFGPYPNWANSPQVLSNAVVSIEQGSPTPVQYGNPLQERTFATDYAVAAGQLGPVFVVLGNTKLPTGTLQSFDIWNQGTPGGSPTPSAGNVFHAYVLRPTGTENAYSVVFDSGQLTVAPPTVPSGEVDSFAAPNVPVQSGDVLAFYGEGIPVDTSVTGTPDTLSYPATAGDPGSAVAPAEGATLALGTDAGFPLYTQDRRTYSFAATVLPTVTDPGTGAEATATVDPKTGSISGVTVTSPGTGYLVPPKVTITAGGVTPTSPATATAQISPGVVSAITVHESGFGFAAPKVVITGGNPTAGAEATAVASGGVDNLTLIEGGSGYTIQPIVKVSLPDLPDGVPATGSAVMDTNGVVTGVDVVDPGSGYTSAPTVTILDADQVNPTPATVTATIGISRIDLTSGGQGYDSAPTVAITDTDGTDRGASATAEVAVKGAVTGVTVTNPGAGYLTPGLKKFVDTLPGQDEAHANDLGQYIPTAVPDTTTYPGTDYYEIALVQYRMQFHRDLPATLLRGYVQLSTSVVPGKQQPLTNANLDPSVAPEPISGYFGVDDPHYLGPTIVATKDKPVRILFRNLLPTGESGDLFLPVDTSMMGSGPGPEMMQLDADGVPMDMAPDDGSVTDGVRNPMCADTPKPDTCYSENRATLHLHGGITPWISDGTPHQWVTPSGENTAYPKGVSVSNVPDMPDPGPGAETFFYTNQQSARLMFYHDHAWGITRLNVYAGQAAGYLLTDDTEKKLTAPGGALDGMGLGTPLIIQDKTFVPDAATMAKVDPTWDAAKWGGEGNLWTPHVYMPAQNPSDPSGMSAFGRWMYGPWFWPPAKDAKYPPIANPYFDPNCDPDVEAFCEPAQIPGTPNNSVGMEAFNDTPVVNGTAYPTTTVDPKAYRYRILNAANDRFWNLSWYVADPTTGTLSEVALKPAEVEAAQTDPNVFPTPDTTKSPAGPSWVQIGTEGGFLPAPVVVPAQPTTWITDPTRFDVGNVDKHSLLLAPAERADVVVDFSQYRGKTLILYNDAPAAFPARVSSYDYYTGGPDLSPAGAPSTLPGYGPNTRTVMQVKVSNTTPAIAFDRTGTEADGMGALNAAFAHHTDGSGVFESGSNPIIVGQAAYNSTYGKTFAGSGFCSSPTNPSAKCDGYARIQQQGGDAFKFDTLSGQQLSIPLQPKGIHDEMNSANFDEFGRMTANMGLEAPGATPLLQNIILYPFSNPATEVLTPGNDTPSSLDVTPISSETDGTQIWKITHNGVDTHPIHFHLYDVQVINRVTWDNIIIPPEPTELGWKDTVRVSPLEDTIVAVRPIIPTVPFGVPDSERPLNPMMPIGAKGSQNGPNGTEAGFNNTDANGNPIAPIVNQIVNMGWEYVWHCHILSHEEMDMMRPVSVEVKKTLPVAPALSFDAAAGKLSWTDGTPVDYTSPVSWTDPDRTAEVGYRIERAPVSNGTVGAYATIGTALANVTTFGTTPPDPALTYAYRVVAWNAAGDSSSNEVTVAPALRATNTVVTSNRVPVSTYGQTVRFRATVKPATGRGPVSGTVQFAVDGVDVGTPVTLVSGAATYRTASLTVGTHDITATYSGSSDFAASTGTYSQVVDKRPTTTVLSSNRTTTPVFGQSVTFTARVVAGAVGTVQFTIDGADAGAPVPLNDKGRATLTTNDLSVASHTVLAIYSGSANDVASTSSELTQAVAQASTRAKVTSSRNRAPRNTPVTFTAVVTAAAPGGGIPTGTVQFGIDGVLSSEVTLVDGRATLSRSDLSPGSHTVVAVYNGSDNHAGVTSPSISQRIT